MAEAALVEKDLEFGRELVLALDKETAESGLRPTAAFWLLFPEEEMWRLVLVLPAMEDHPPQEVYRRLIAVMNARLPSLDGPTDAIGLAPPDLPIVRLLGAAIQTPADALTGIRFTHNVINGELIEDAYIYRLAATPAAHPAQA